MGFLQRLRSALSGRSAEGAGQGNTPDAGHRYESFLVFANTGEVMHAETELRRAGVMVRVMAPPPALRTGCDMVLVVPDEQVLRAEYLLGLAGIAPLQTINAGHSLLAPVSLLQHRDFGDHLMVRAANMKITVEKSTGVIVNISGGGCPDVPYLAAMLIGQSLHGGHSPREYGSTLCGYALELAFVEAQRLLADRGKP